jgi:hypothetical protein
MDTRTVLARAIKHVVESSKDDSMALAALAVQQSECGAARRVDAIIATLKDLPVPNVEPINANSIRAVVMKESGLHIELNDPFLLMLIATQDLGLDRLERVVAEIKHRNSLQDEILEMIQDKWILSLLILSALCAAFLLGAFLPKLLSWFLRMII